MADILEVVVFEVLRVLDGCSNAHRTRPPLAETRPGASRSYFPWRFDQSERAVIDPRDSRPVPSWHAEIPTGVENSGLNFFAIETIFHDRTRALETEISRDSKPR
jgi:hypothetical protein